MKKILVIALAAALVLSLVLPGVAWAQQSLKVDKYKPVPASDVELAMKRTVERPGRPGPPVVPPGKEKKKDKEAAATGILGAPVPEGGMRYAIVVGISDYPGTGNDLNYMDDDADDMISALNLYGFDAIISLIDREGTEAAGLVATREAIIQAIVETGLDVTANDEVVFFFSGHGGRGKAEDGDREKVDECIWAHDGSKLVPIWDGELKALFEEGASVGEYPEYDGYHTSRIVFIFDSCYSGGMTDLKAEGRVLAMATTENTVGYESATWENGEFTYYLVDQGMLEGLADKYDHDEDSVLLEETDVTVEEAWDYAKANCQLDKPTISDSFDNDLLL